MATFKTRARALDMLGRQQIASIPTAISEIFKNAYDAYADTVEADYFESSGLFVIRDDGLGMTKEEFENRWLVIGTESKLGTGKGIKKARTDPNKDERPIMGEKGIGRLAIALIGPQVLVLTRAKYAKKDELVAAFIHWGFFECPGINLEDINIPIKTFSGGSLPTQKDMQEMISAVDLNLENNKNLFPKELFTKIKIDLKKASYSIQDLNKFFLDCNFPKEDYPISQPLLTGDGKGTHFYILPTDPILADDIKVDIEGKNEISRLRRFLLGFTNTMIPNAKKIPLQTAFRVWDRKFIYIDLINSRDFFTKEEFLSTDHNIIGKFDENGTFVGKIKVFDQEVDYKVNVNKADNILSCGSFKIDLAIIPGKPRDSKMSDEDYTAVKSKTELLGGLYIYKDGIRILPYGDTDFDWLDIEKRRTKSAYYYFYSYRRIFGAISIDSKNNKNLKEKAGREGFQENKAYREMKNLLKEFLIQTAGDFFRKDSEFFRLRDDLRRLDQAKKEIERRQKETKNTFQQNLDHFYRNIQDTKLSEFKSELIKEFEVQLSNAHHLLYPELIKEALLKTEYETKKKIENFRKSITVNLPSDLGLTKEIQNDYNVYLSEFELISNEFLKPLYEEIDNIFLQKNLQAQTVINQREKTEHIKKYLYDLLTNNISQKNKELEDKQSDSILKIRKIINEINEDINKIKLDINQKLDKDLNDHQINSLQSDFRDKVLQKNEEYLKILGNLLNEISYFTSNEMIEGSYITESDLIGSLKTENSQLREELDLTTELSQLGMAIEIINHEFNQTVGNLRKNIKVLNNWAKKNPGFQKTYIEIRNNFEHLDSYLNLFSPLSRRLNRQPIEMIGEDIENYLIKIFYDRFAQYQIDFSSTKNFRNCTIIGYPSVFYPIFVNLIDNSIFWLQDITDRARKIVLDMKYDGILISDNGTGISKRDQGLVFEYGFSRKPQGRGLGLYISKRNLEKTDYEISLAPSVYNPGTTFKISKK